MSDAPTVVPPTTPAEVVDENPRLVMNPDPAATQACAAPDLQIRVAVRTAGSTAACSLGARIGAASAGHDVLNFASCAHGNRVGIWRCRDHFDRLALPAAARIDTALDDHCPELIAACAARDAGQVWATTPGAICAHVAVQASLHPEHFA
jgi:hypothetical protein